MPVIHESAAELKQLLSYERHPVQHQKAIALLFTHAAPTIFYSKYPLRYGFLPFLSPFSFFPNQSKTGHTSLAATSQKASVAHMLQEQGSVLDPQQEELSGQRYLFCSLVCQKLVFRMVYF